MYFLVLLQLLPDAPADVPAHEPFIDSLIERHLVLLGGGFGSEPVDGVIGGYLLHVTDQAQAEAIVATDPYLTSGACTATITHWDLVGIDREAIDHDFD
ncbi:YciI family protein [Kribbella italica]|uniref:YCII-related domain-containing protein n=1 Tax=Kribbella italica TaxID=1540520 RepID=A0A7W9JBF6_9ACTN|nr:hypothetical protein [Kribbella italica]MBB5839092.1 hypothetical protein [Kribbella italica]